MRKLKQEWDKLSVKKNLTGAEALKAVKKNGYELQYVSVQTPEICLEAVKKNGYELKYVSVQTPEICLEAVKQNGYALQYVIIQTPEICLEAVKQDDDALRYVSSEMLNQENEFTIEELEELTGIMNLKIKK